MNWKKITKKLLYRIKVGSLMLASGVVTTYIGINCYEIVFHQDLMYVHAVESFHSPWIINDLVEPKNPTFEQTQQLIRLVHDPKSLKFPVFSSRMEIIPAIRNGTNWLELENKGQYIALGESGESGVGNMIVYMRKDWRTIAEPEKLIKGSKFYLETKDYTNQYKVVELKEKPIHEEFILNDLPKSYFLMIIEDTRNEVNYFIKAVFVSQDRNM